MRCPSRSASHSTTHLRSGLSSSALDARLSLISIFFMGGPLLQFHPLFAGTSPLLKVFTRACQFPPNVAQIPSWLAQDARFCPPPKIASPTPTSFRAKTDGPNWAADASDTPNPARIGSPDPLDRFIHSCFVAVG